MMDSMKKVMKVMGFLFLAGVITAGIVWWYSRTSNPWNAKSVGNTPARDGHIVRNFNPVSNPWFFFNGDESRLRGFLFRFEKSALRHD